MVVMLTATSVWVLVLMFVTAAAVLMHITFVHIVELFYSFTLQIYPKVHATELQNTRPIRGQIAKSMKKHQDFNYHFFKFALRTEKIA